MKHLLKMNRIFLENSQNIGTIVVDNVDNYKVSNSALTAREFSCPLTKLTMWGHSRYVNCMYNENCFKQKRA